AQRWAICALSSGSCCYRRSWAASGDGLGLSASRRSSDDLAPRVAAAGAMSAGIREKPGRWGKGRGGRPWRRLVEAVKRRDKYTCQACGRVTEDGECDHIVPLSQGGTDDLSNLQWLCREPCHRVKTAREGSGASNHPEWLPKPACKVELVTGPPGAGKTTYCREKAKDGDVII